MPIATRKTKASAIGGRKAVRRTGKATEAKNRKAISAAVQDYVATHFDALIGGLMSDDAALAALFSQIDQNLDAAERRTARLLAGQT